MIQPRTKRCHGMKPFMYEMAKRKENWQSLKDHLEAMITVPPEQQSAVVREVVPEHSYPHLAEMLDFRRTIVTLPPEQAVSIDTIIPFIPIEKSSIEVRKYVKPESQLSITSTLSHTSSSSEDIKQDESIVSKEPSKEWSHKTETLVSSDNSDVMSDFVEVEKKIAYNKKLALQHKAIRRFLDRPREEVATWLKSEEKRDDSEMSFEEEGVKRINKIAADFCEWVRSLGGDEQSFVSEDVLKELFQIQMDYPAARALSISEKEKRVLYHKLARSMGVPGRSFLKALSKQLKWDAAVEKRPSRLRAFVKQLPKELRFKTPQNKTAETWLEWNQLSDEVTSFADVYGPVKDLRSTQEYCRWLRRHPDQPRPKYLVDQGLFKGTLVEAETTLRPISSRVTLLSGASMVSTDWGLMQ